MKRLLINGNQTNFLFSKESKFNDIFEWITEQLMYSNDNIFELNEAHSCFTYEDGNNISISGDEDYKLITIEEIKPIL